MKFVIRLYFLFQISSLSSIAQLQSTWNKTLFLNIGNTAYHHDSLSIGPASLGMRNDGKYFLLNMDYEQGQQTIYFMDSLGGIINTFDVGDWLTLQEWDSYGMKVTPDGGVVFIQHYFDFGGGPGAPLTYSLMKISNGGVMTNLHTWNYPDELLSVIPHYHGGYYCKVNSSTLDYATGLIYPDSAISPIVFTNDEFLFVRNTIQRSSLSGTVAWQIPSDGYSYLCNSEASVYLKNDSIRKIDALTGNIIWTKYISTSGYFVIDKKSDGFINVNNNILTVYDSSGNYINQNSIGLIYGNPRVVSSSPDGSIYVGGIYRTNSFYYPNFTRSSILIKLNEEGHGVVDSTNMFWPSDADNDSALYYFDDAVVIAAAIGQSSTANTSGGFNITTYSYATDWATSFESGLNYKYADVDGNGVINNSDLMSMPLAMRSYSQTAVFPLHSDSTGVPVSFIPRSAGSQIGDTIEIDLILGSTAIPFDSIYGVSLQFSSCGPPQFDSTYFRIKNGVLGDTLSNLFFDTPLYNQNIINGIVVCRNDHQNVSIAGDTLMQIIVRISPWAIPGTFQSCPAIHVITKGGFSIPVNVISEPIDFLLDVKSNVEKNLDISISPIPAKESLRIELKDSFIESIIIKTLTGVEVFRDNYSQKVVEMDTKELINGVYFMQCMTSNGTICKRILIQH